LRGVAISTFLNRLRPGFHFETTPAKVSGEEGIPSKSGRETDNYSPENNFPKKSNFLAK
jgi:hypothetical protein